MASREPDEAVIERAAQAMLDEIGNGDRLDPIDQYLRITTVQLSSADLCGMARAALAAIGPAQELDAVIEEIQNGLSLRLNNHLVEMKEGYDDSIVGFNEAWSIVSDYLHALASPEKVTAAEAAQNAMDGLDDKAILAYGSGGPTPPAASDLRERARTLIRRMRDAGESYEMLASWFAAEFAAIRAEAKAAGYSEGWQDNNKAATGLSADLTAMGQKLEAAEAALSEAKTEGFEAGKKWQQTYGAVSRSNHALAANRPQPTGREDK